MENIKLIRHLEEEQDFARNNRNGHVLESEYYKIPIFSQSIRSTLDSVSKKTVKLITSSQNRSMETAELVSKSLIKDSINTSEIQIDPRSGPLKHGEYSICSDGETIDENSKISKIAQKAYVHETIHRRNIFYRHGDPAMVNGIARYPELIGKFNTYGENQIDFSIRFYSFILDLIHLYETEPNEYIIMLTHNVIVSRIIGLQKIAQDLPNSPINPSEVSGKLYYLEWYAGISVQGNFSYKEFFKQHNYIFDVSMAHLQKIRIVLESEIEVMTRLKNSVYYTYPENIYSLYYPATHLAIN